MNNVLQALAEPKRREILSLVQTTERSAGDIAAHFNDISRPAISQHLKVLSDAGLVSLRKQGTHRFYSVRPEGLSELRQFLNQFWIDELQALKQAAKTVERTRKKLAP